MNRYRSPGAFTLVEVMVAIAIFFMAMFAILGVMSSGVHAAAILRTSGPTAGMIAAQIALTNQMQDETVSGSFGGDNGIGVYKDYRWAYQCRQVATNGLFQIDFVVIDPNGVQSSLLSTIFYRPDSSTGMGLQPQRQ
jgi:hypothetical protein